MSPSPRPRPSQVRDHHHVPAREHRPSHRSLVDRLRSETTAGLLLVVAVVLAMAWANSPWRETYDALAHAEIGPESLGLSMSVSHWAADGLLAIFFFVIGLELRHEFTMGALRNPRQAALPMIAAVFGMVVPALIYVGVQLASGSDATGGWAIPTATDIAFALALLGLFGRGLPPGVRVFLMTLAVVDDLLAIIIIAVFFANGVNLAVLAASLAVIAVFAVLVARRVTSPWLLVPLALVAWALMYRSGVHATIAGVLLGAVVPAVPRSGEKDGMAHRWSHAFAPLSNGFVLPVFAFFAAGVTVDGGLEMLANPVSIGIMAGLVVGKVIGIFGGVMMLTRLTPLRLAGGVDPPDILAASCLAGIGFTVSLLIADLSFGATELSGEARLAVVAGSVIATVIGGVLLHRRSKVHIRGRGTAVRQPHQRTPRVLASPPIRVRLRRR